MKKDPDQDVTARELGSRIAGAWLFRVMLHVVGFDANAPAVMADFPRH